MPQLISTTTMVKRLSGLIDTEDLNEWEQRFVKSLVVRMNESDLTKLFDKQVETLDRLHSKHFA